VIADSCSSGRAPDEEVPQDERTGNAPRAISVGALADFDSQRIEGFAREGNKFFSVPLFSHIAGNLWMGGCPVKSAPKEFDYVVSFYPWGEYHVHQHQVHTVATLFDSADQPLQEDRLLTLAHTIRRYADTGPTLVHCQAGLNRSGLLTALTLMVAGMSADSAIRLLREKRCDAVLCNRAFEKWLRALPQGGSCAQAAGHGRSEARPDEQGAHP
jgi:protein tyrosine phosphatase (PTP) superfamily phosphohydrolase (DUF442 family)